MDFLTKNFTSENGNSSAKHAKDALVLNHPILKLHSDSNNASGINKTNALLNSKELTNLLCANTSDSNASEKK